MHIFVYILPNHVKLYEKLYEDETRTNDNGADDCNVFRRDCSE